MSGRIRTLKPEWLDDEKLAAASREARLLSVALILISDDWGNGRAHTLLLAARVYPYGDPRESLASIEQGLAELGAIGFVQLYKVAGQQYFHVRNWSKHQKVDHPGKPRVPKPDDPSAEPLSRESRESLAPDHDLRPVPPTTDLDQDHERDRACARARGTKDVPFDDLLEEAEPSRPPPADTDPVTWTQLAADHETGWQTHRPREAYRANGMSSERFIEAAKLCNEQARLDAAPPQAVRRGVMAQFWKSDRIRQKLNHAPGAIASQFSELYAAARAARTSDGAPAMPAGDPLLAKSRRLQADIDEAIQAGNLERAAEARKQLEEVAAERRRRRGGQPT